MGEASIERNRTFNSIGTIPICQLAMYGRCEETVALLIVIELKIYMNTTCQGQEPSTGMYPLDKVTCICENALVRRDLFENQKR